MLPQTTTATAGKQLRFLESSVGKSYEIRLEGEATNSGSGQDAVSVGSPTKRSSGVSVLDIHPAQIPCNIGGIKFKNYYTGFITMRVKIKTEDNTGDIKDGCEWRTCLHQHQLMPNNHCETGSQDYFTLTQTEMLFPPRNVMLVRLVLQQPSPLWITFRLEDITLLSDSLEEGDGDSSVLEWLQEQGGSAVEDQSQERRKDATAEQVAEHLQKMWALTETLKISQQTQSSLGRFDVDGSYEINLLSYN